MRLVIKDYLTLLKEKDELDLLLCDLLLQMGYLMDNKPETGNRQYGVDIRAYTETEVLLCVVKQGKLNRENWDSGQNAVRQSLNEIHDVYLRLMSKEDREKQLRIAVITNNVMDEAVRPAWEGYVSENTNWSGIPVKLEFWGIDKLVADVQQYLFEEKLFGADKQKLLRRALYFIGEGDYRNEFFEQIIDGYQSELHAEDTPRQRDKKLAGLYLATQMIAQYAADTQIYKIAIMVTEYLIIRYWKFLLQNQLFEKKPYMEWLIKFLSAYEKWNDQYYEAVRYCCEEKDRIPCSHSVEQRVMLYEMLGYLTTYAYYLYHKGKNDKKIREKSVRVQLSVVSLVKKYVQFPYAPYDNHIGIISMLYRLQDAIGDVDGITYLMDYQCMRLGSEYNMHGKYPAPSDTYEEALEISHASAKSEYRCSGFWGGMLQWMVLMDQKELYEKLKGFLKETLREVTKCAWFLRADEELKLYDRHAMNLAGDGTCFEIEDSFEELKKRVEFTVNQYKDEAFSYETYSFPALEFIVSRYYGYLVRIKREN